MNSWSWGFVLFVLLSFVPLSSLAAKENKLSARASELVRLIDEGDYLGARIAVRKVGEVIKDRSSWLEVRQILHSHPVIGWDLIRHWEVLAPGSKQIHELQKKVRRQLAIGDRLMLGKRFEKAFARYQSVAQYLKKRQEDHADNAILYHSILHSMARALYGAGRYKESKEVYSWISPIYPHLRQVMFEKMWAAFRAGDISRANGAVASQYSSYFGPVMNPESFLVQLYIYRKLCRDDDLRLVLLKVRELKEQLENGAIGAKQWALSDLETRSYVSILDKSSTKASFLVDEAERDLEAKRIMTMLKKRFEQEKANLLRQMKRVEAYANMAVSSTSKELPRIKKLPSYDALLEAGYELWPVDDAEDWIDELGHHYFIGESECGKRSLAP